MRLLFAFIPLILASPLSAGDGRIPVMRVEPLPANQASFIAGATERTRWHFDPDYPRPFFFPFNGPSGSSLTRMGHPGDTSHDHHRSLWFAHHDVEGFSFWADGKGTQIRQKAWLCYQDGDAESSMAVRLGWFAPDGRELMEQELIAALRALPDGETTLELQSLFRPAAGLPKVQLGKTNFGFLAVRVAKSISEHFGGGILTNSEGQVHEAEIFGKPAEWMDYSGPVAPDGKTEGITYFNHPSNPRSPAKWHVRQDGWMGASVCMDEGLTITPESPLRLRYLLHAHSGPLDSARAKEQLSSFANRPSLEIAKPTGKHLQWEIRRISAVTVP